MTLFPYTTLFRSASLFAVLTFSFVRRTVFFLLLVLETVESVAWYFSGAGFNLQVLMAIDFTWVISRYQGYFYFIAAVLVVLLLVACVPRFPVSHNISLKDFGFYVVGFMTCTYRVVKLIQGNFDPFADNRKFGSWAESLYYGPLVDFWTANMSAKRRPDAKNIITIAVESLEQGTLGHFYHNYPNTMPYLSSMVTNNTFFSQFVSSPYTQWSAASLFTSQCNLPLVMTQSQAYLSAKFHLLRQHRCLGHFLSMAGYKLMSYYSGPSIAGMKQMLRLHGYDAKDSREHRKFWDWDLFDNITRSVLPSLEKQQPFMLHILTGDTHPFPSYSVDPRCLKRTKGYPMLLESFDCVDQTIERFLQKFKNSPLANNTEVLIYGDHLIMKGARRGIHLYEPRYIFGGMPLRPPLLITKRISMYDIAPTIMELAGVEYEPKFPFGASVFSSKVGTVPTQSHLQFIYSNFVKIMNWNPNAVCDELFCRDQMYLNRPLPRTNRSTGSQSARGKRPVRKKK
jgi:hypothetical protein